MSDESLLGVGYPLAVTGFSRSDILYLLIKHILIKAISMTASLKRATHERCRIWPYSYTRATCGADSAVLRRTHLFYNGRRERTCAAGLYCFNINFRHRS